MPGGTFGFCHRRSDRSRSFSRRFQKLLLNFTWWLNREDPEGNNLFGGGFLDSTTSVPSIDPTCPQA
jgi:hypothetical protein